MKPQRYPASCRPPTTATGCAPITAPGGVGIRGDNDNFQFDNFTVTRM